MIGRKLLLAMIYVFFAIILIGCDKTTQSNTQLTIEDNSTTQITTINTDVTLDTSTENQTNVYDDCNEEIKQRMELLIDTKTETASLKINRGLSATVHADTSGVSVTYFSSQMEALYDFSNMYYFGSYTDNHSNDYWKKIDVQGDNLIITESDNYVISKDVTNSSFDNFNGEIPVYEEYMDLFLDTMDYQKEGEDVYYINCHYLDLIDEPMFETYFYGLERVVANGAEDLLVRIEYTFTDSSISLSIDYLIYVDTELVQRMTVSYSSTLSFTQSYNVFTYNSEDYYYKPETNISDIMEVYDTEDEIKLAMNANTNYFVKYNMSPGYYRFNVDYLGEDLILYDDQGNIIKNQPFFKIVESGNYYMKIKLRSTEKVNLTGYKIPESEVGTIDSPIYAIGSFSGSISKDIDAYHLVEGSVSGYILKLTCTSLSNSNAAVITSYNNLSIGFGEGTTRYILVQPNEDVILKFISSYVTDYEISIEKLPFSEGVLDIENMPLLTVCSTISEMNDYTNRIYQFFAAETGSLYSKFVVTEAGYYKARVDFGPFTVSEENANYSPSQTLYDSEGNVLSTTAEQQTYLEPGTYYIEVYWFEGYYAIANIYIEN